MRKKKLDKVLAPVVDSVAISGTDISNAGISFIQASQIFNKRANPFNVYNDYTPSSNQDGETSRNLITDYNEEKDDSSKVDNILEDLNL